MAGPWIEFLKWPSDEEMLHFCVRASDGEYVAAQEFYGHASDLEQFGSALARFPASRREACNNGHDPWRREARFTIRCEVASLNRLGAALQVWLHDSDQAIRVELTAVGG